MSLDGYRGSKVDTNWWLEQIKHGEEFRKKFAYEQQWQTWRSYYRGNWADDIMPLNLFYTYMRTIVPRIYFRDPTISISPTKPGLENMMFARIMERIDTKLLKNMKFKRVMKSTVQDAFLLGTGIAKLGFGGFYSPTIMDDYPGAPTDSKGFEVEHHNTESMMPWVAKTNPGNFVVPYGTKWLDHSRWVAEKIVRPISDIQRDPRFTNTAGLKSFDVDGSRMAAGSIVRPIKVANLYEIRDTYTGKVFVLAPDHSKDNKLIYEGADLFLTSYGGFPYFLNTFNEDDEAVWGLPDSKILEYYQLEINEIKTQIQRHRRLSLVKILIKDKAMSESEAEKLVSEDVGAVAFIRGQGDIRSNVLYTNSTIPRELFVAADTLMQDTRESLGFSRNEFGEFNSRSGDTTATEANIVKMASEIRIDERRDGLADSVVDFVRMMHGVVLDNWGDEQVVDLIGPGGVQVWLRVRGESLRKNKFSIKVDPDTAIPETRASREQRAIQLYQFLSANPLIDPIKLTQYLLHEMKGPQFDDIMKMLPGVNGAGDRPIEVSDFGNMLQQSISNAGAQNVSLPNAMPQG
jgi:hypothetical protein